MTVHVLTDVTLVLGPPLHDTPAFHDFQARSAGGGSAGGGGSVAAHEWAHHEHAAVDGLTRRDGPVATHTLLETFVGGALGVNVIIADVERQWVRHADGHLYASVTFATDDVRPRAAAVALQQDAAIEALDRVADPLATLDGRAWLSWSSRSAPEVADEARVPRTSQLMARIADAVLADAHPAPGAPVGDAAPPRDLAADLLRAIALGAAHADQPGEPLVKELRDLRHRDPLRIEWNAVHMDAFLLAAQAPEQIDAKLADGSAAGLAYLYVGRHRTDRLKADPYITARFHRELAARAYMTAYVLQRLAPAIGEHLLHVMRGA